MNKLFLLVFVVLTAVSLHGAIVHVPADQATIQGGIGMAVNGDTVLVAAGTYGEAINLLGKRIVLKSEQGQAATVIHGVNPGTPTVTLSSGEDTTTVVDGFTIKGASSGFGVYCSNSSPVIQNCEVTECTSDWDGAGIWFVNSAMKIRNCRIHHNNSGNSGGGVGGTLVNGVEIDHNYIYANSAPHGPGIGLIDPVTSAVIRYNVVYDNVGGDWVGAGIYVNGVGCQVINNTVSNNTSGIEIIRSAGNVLQNNIVTENEYRGIYCPGGTIDYNDVWSNGVENNAGVNGINDDPRFLDVANRDYRLLSTSPCIDAGNPDPIYDDPDGSLNDMGALPYGDQIIVFPRATNVGFGAGMQAGFLINPVPTIYWQYYDTAATTQTEFEIEVGDNADWTAAEMWQPGPMTSSDASVVYGGAAFNDRQTYYLRVRVNNGLGWGEWARKAFTTRFSRIVHVPADQATIQGGIGMAVNGDTVLVAAGTYGEAINLLGKRIVLKSEQGQAATVIHGVNPGTPTVTLSSGEDTTTVVDGFTIKGASSGFGVYCSNSSPVIQNCEVTECTSDWDGAGIWFVNSAMKIRNCRIHHNNSGNSGGGVGGTLVNGVEIDHNYIYANSAPHGPGIGLIDPVTSAVIRYNVVYDNVGGDWVGAGIYVNGVGCQVINNTVSNNTSGIEIIRSAGNVLQNNIVTENEYRGIYCPGGTIDYNDVWSNGVENNAGVNGINDDPRFLDVANRDYRLLSTSPCIDAGNPDPIYDDPDGSLNDMGALPKAALRGDANGDYAINISDVVFLLHYIFTGGAAPVPIYTGDVDCNDRINIADAVCLINYIFLGGPAPCSPVE